MRRTVLEELSIESWVIEHCHKINLKSISSSEMEVPKENGKGIRDETIDEEHLMSVWSKFGVSNY